MPLSTVADKSDKDLARLETAGEDYRRARIEANNAFACLRREIKLASQLGYGPTAIGRAAGVSTQRAWQITYRE